MKFSSGLPETACGLGSTLRMTTEIRRRLPALLSTCGIIDLLDAPCGDGNWISETDLTGIAYHGIDASAENLQTFLDKTWKSAPSQQAFSRGDLLAMDLPPADAIMCRDFVQHLPHARIAEFLKKISGTYTWLLATSFDCETNVEIGSAGFRPINLQAAPFNLGSPEHEIPDPPGSGRILGAWLI